MQDIGGWHVPELAKGVVVRETTPFASQGMYPVLMYQP